MKRLLALAFALLFSVTASAQVTIPARLIRLTQVDASGAPLGPVTEIFCPPTGCQQPVSVVFEGATENYMLAIDVVLRGVYLAIASRTVGTAAVMDFNTGRPGPSFLATRGRDRVLTTMKFLVVRDKSVRRERGFDADKRVQEGDVFNRGRAPDLFFQVEVLVAES